MSKAVQALEAAIKQAISTRPPVGGFPHFAESLRKSGLISNTWYLPSAHSLYNTKEGHVVMVGTPLISGAADIPQFDKEALIKALRTDQAGKSTFPEFLASSWQAGVVKYDVDFIGRKVTYFGFGPNDFYVEEYPVVDVK